MQQGATLQVTECELVRDALVTIEVTCAGET